MHHILYTNFILSNQTLNIGENVTLALQFTIDLLKRSLSVNPFDMLVEKSKKNGSSQYIDISEEHERCSRYVHACFPLFILIV